MGSPFTKLGGSELLESTAYSAHSANVPVTSAVTLVKFDRLLKLKYITLATSIPKRVMDGNLGIGVSFERASPPKVIRTENQPI